MTAAGEQFGGEDDDGAGLDADKSGAGEGLQCAVHRYPGGSDRFGKSLLRAGKEFSETVAGKVGFSSLLPSLRAGSMVDVPTRNVLIVLFDGVQSLDVTGPLEVFSVSPAEYRRRF